MLSIADAQRYLDGYLEGSGGAAYAVLIVGPWGAGKTHFVDAYFKDREKKSRIRDPLYRKEHIYVTLNGVSDASQISAQIFGQIYPAFASRPFRLFSKIVTRAANAASRRPIFADADAADVQALLIDLTNRILIFDDLERCKLPISESLGLINHFVEHDKIKTIIIAYEDKIAPQDLYLEHKEKVVGKTLSVTSAPETVLDAIITGLPKSYGRDVAVLERDEVLRVLRRTKATNYRSLRFVLSEFSELATEFSDILQRSEHAAKQLLILLLAVGMEYRAGRLTSKHIAKMAELRSDRMVAIFTKKELSEDAAALSKIEESYPEVEWDDPLVPPEALATLLSTGTSDREALRSHLSSHPLVAGTAGTPAWRRLWNWSSLPFREYEVAIATLKLELENRSHSHPGVLLHIAGILTELAEFGDDNIVGEDIFALFTTYLSSVKLEPDMTVFERSMRAYGNIGYHSLGNPTFKKILAMVRTATLSSLHESLAEAAATFVEKAISDPEACLKLHQYPPEGYANQPFLHHIDSKDFVRALIVDSAPNEGLISSLIVRFDRPDSAVTLSEEIPWLHALRDDFEQEISTVRPPYRRLLELRVRDLYSKLGETILRAT